MSMYTTGELARLCGVSVRTVQYYDERGILTPSELSEGGRRLFSDTDLKTLETICFLRELGISIKDIADILKSTESKEVIELLLRQQEEELEKEIREKSAQLAKVKGIQREMIHFKDASEKSIHDMSIIMESRKKLKKSYQRLLVVGLLLDGVTIGTFLLGLMKGIWYPFIIGFLIAVIVVFGEFNHLYGNVSYLCPECHTEFKPRKREVFFANHTPRTRKLSCPLCNRKMWCIELYQE